MAEWKPVVRPVCGVLAAALALGGCGEVRRAQRQFDNLDAARTAARQGRQLTGPGMACRRVADPAAGHVDLAGFDLPLVTASDGHLTRVGSWAAASPTVAPAAEALIRLDTRQERLCVELRTAGGAAMAPDVDAAQRGAVEDMVQLLLAFRDASSTSDFARRTAGPVARARGHDVEGT